MKTKLMHSTITFVWVNKKLKFDVLHNLNEYGLDLEAAFINYAARIEDKPSLLDFCNYVESKDINIVCRPKYRREVKP